MEESELWDSTRLYISAVREYLNQIREGTRHFRVARKLYADSRVPPNHYARTYHGRMNLGACTGKTTAVRAVLASRVYPLIAVFPTQTAVLDFLHRGDLQETHATEAEALSLDTPWSEKLVYLFDDSNRTPPWSEFKFGAPRWAFHLG